jgi:hypothetical protein
MISDSADLLDTRLNWTERKPGSTSVPSVVVRPACNGMKLKVTATVVDETDLPSAKPAALQDSIQKVKVTDPKCEQNWWKKSTLEAWEK